MTYVCLLRITGASPLSGSLVSVPPVGRGSCPRLSRLRSCRGWLGGSSTSGDDDDPDSDDSETVLSTAVREYTQVSTKYQARQRALSETVFYHVDHRIIVNMARPCHTRTHRVKTDNRVNGRKKKRVKTCTIHPILRDIHDEMTLDSLYMGRPLLETECTPRGFVSISDETVECQTKGMPPNSLETPIAIAPHSTTATQQQQKRNSEQQLTAFTIHHCEQPRHQHTWRVC